jgi:transposase InsO family protein
MFERLSEVLACLDRMLPQHPEARLEQLRAGLRQGLETVRPAYTVLRQAGEWLHQVRQILDPDRPSARTGEEVRQELWKYLDHLPEEASHPQLGEFGAALRQVTQNYDAGLFLAYDLPGLPRTNNGRESEFQDLKHRLLATTGQKGAVRRLLQREGAWELIPRPTTLKDTIAVLTRVAPDELRQEQQRVQEHRNRFRLHVRSAKQSAKQLGRLEQRWAALHAARGP